MNIDVHALSGAYVLDALSDDERAEFERHLTDCETCWQEALELRETAARLALAATTRAPPWLRHAVLAEVDSVRQVSSGDNRAFVEPLSSFARSWTVRLAATAAGVLLITAAALGALLVREQQTREDVQARADGVATILRADDTRITRLQDDSGNRMTIVFSHDRNRMMLLAELPPAPSGHDYQVWTIGHDVRSVGLLVPRDGHASLEVGELGDAEQVSVTIEPTGGSRQPTTPTIMQARLRAG